MKSIAAPTSLEPEQDGQATSIALVMGEGFHASSPGLRLADLDNPAGWLHASFMLATFMPIHFKRPPIKAPIGASQPGALWIASIQ
jgi:hypothetical protein